MTIIINKLHYDAILKESLKYACKTTIVKCSECKAELDEACDIIHYWDKLPVCEYCNEDLRGY